MKFEEVILGYRRKYLEALAGNQSLVVKKINDVQGFDVSLLDSLWEVPFCEKVLLPFLFDGSTETLQLFPEEAEGRRASSALASIVLEHDRHYRDTGDWNLAFGYPFLEGRFKDGTLVRAPIFLFPVNLESMRLHSRKPGWGITQLLSTHAMVNESLVRGFEDFNHDVIPEDYQPVFDLGKGVRGLGIVKAVQTLFARMNLQNFPEGRISGSVEPLRAFDQLPEYSPGTFVISNSLVLGMFPQEAALLCGEYSSIADSGFVPDILSNEPAGTSHQLPEDIQADENRFSFLTPLDSSQERSVQAASLGHNTVIQGAPGTGKTQVLLNIIGDSLVKGKKILVVSPKRPDLDELYSRGESAGISKFMMLVHNPIIDKDRVFESLRRRVEEHDEAPREDDHESEKLKRRNLELSHDIEKNLAKLDALRQALFEQTPEGKTLVELYRETSRDPALVIPEIAGNPGEYGNMGHESIHLLEQLLDTAAARAQLLMPGHPAADRRSFAFSGTHEQEQWIASLDRAIGEASLFREPGVNRLLPWAGKEMAGYENPASCCSALISLLGQAAREVEAAQLLAPEKVVDRERLETLVGSLQTSHAWQPKFWKALKELTRTSRNQGGIIAFSRKLRYSLSILQRLDEIAGSCSIRISYGTKESISRQISQLLEEAETISRVYSTISSLGVFLLPGRIRSLFADISGGRVDAAVEYLEALKDEITLNFTDISLLDSETEAAGEVSRDTLKHMAAHFLHDADTIRDLGRQAVCNSVNLCRISEIERRHIDILRYTENSEKIIDDIISLMGEKQSIIPKLAARKIRQGISNLLEKSWQPREICKQVHSGESSISLRHCVREFFQEGLLDLYPCWVMPASAALLLFPPVDAFDIIIFDNASIIGLSEAIPLLLRAKTAVICGDPMMPAPPDTQLPSLMEASASLETIPLKFHYRSEDERLFAFVNAAFLGGAVHTLPMAGTASSPIEVIRHNDPAGKAVQLLRNIICEEGFSETAGIVSLSGALQDRVIQAIQHLASEDQVFRNAFRTQRERFAENRYEGLVTVRPDEAQGIVRDNIIMVADEQSSSSMMYSALTRASKRIYAVLPESADQHETINQFLQYVNLLQGENSMLRQFLAELSGRQQQQVDDVLMEAVRELENRGFEVHTNVGLSPFCVDAAVYDPQQGRYILGILCEDCETPSRKGTVYRKRVLESRGWNICCFWGRNWFNDADRVIDQIIDVVPKTI